MEEMKSFPDKVIDQISGPIKRKIPITFPEPVFLEFAKLARDEAADCYWLAIKQLIDFKRDQIEGDLKTIMVMQQIQDLKEQLDIIHNRLLAVEKPVRPVLKTFGNGEVK